MGESLGGVDGDTPVARNRAFKRNGVWLVADGVWRSSKRSNIGNIWRVSMKAMIAWISYIWLTTLAGLAIHPYQSVKRMVLREQILLPVTLSPVIGLVGLFVMGRVGSYVMDLNGLPREFMALILGSTLFGLLLWQALLLVLVVRFWRAR